MSSEISTLAKIVAESILYASANHDNLKKTRSFINKSFASYLNGEKLKIRMSRSKKNAENAEKPKRALSAFMYYSKEQRDILKAKNPAISFQEMGKILGTAWKALSETEKAKYVDMSKADQERYANEKKALN
jgi:hypothetical protein